MSTLIPTERLMRILQATPEMQTNIDRLLEGKVILVEKPAAASATAMPFEYYIDKAEVSKRLCVQPRTVDDWMKKRILPFYKVGRSVRFKWSEIEKHLANTSRIEGRR